MIFEGLSAFPLTPMDERGIDEAAFVGLVTRLAEAGVDSIGALGSTGNYAYLTRAERSRVARRAVEAADGTPVMVSVGSTRTSHVIELVDDAQAAGAAALLLAPVSYQPLYADEVFELYAEVDRHVSVPLCVYDNPSTTHFAFSDDLYRDVARLASVQAIKIPAPPNDEAATRIPQVQALAGSDAVIGVSGDSLAAASMLAGAPAWFSVIGGLLPEAALAIARAAQSGDAAQAIDASDRLGEFWALFETYGSVRVVAAAAARLGLTQTVNLPRPLRPLEGSAQQQLDHTLDHLGMLIRTEEGSPCTQ